MHTASQTPQQSSEFLRALVLGALIGLAGLLICLPWLRHHPWHRPAAAPPVVTAPQMPGRAIPSIPSIPAIPAPPSHGPLADFRGTTVSAAVRETANWSFYTGDNQGRSVVIIDKPAASVYVFSPAGKLLASTPALVGLTRGDDAEAGIGNKPLSEVRNDEKISQAGRFVAEMGKNTGGEDIVWIDYDSGLAMHRVINTNPAERRLQRLASPDPRQRRISFGCINLPPRFYNEVLSPTVKKTGAIIYVLPEVHTLAQEFGAWDVTDPNAKPPAQAIARRAIAVPTAPRAPRQLRDDAPVTADSAVQ